MRAAPIFVAAAVAAVLVAPHEARAQDEKLAPDRVVEAPFPPSPGSRSGALWAALASATSGVAVDDVLAATGFAFHATVCANDCPCIEWREDALGIAPAARAFGFDTDDLDLTRTSPDIAFGRIKASLDSGRAVIYAGPHEVGVIAGYKSEPRTIFVRESRDGEQREEARPVERLADLWELTFLAPGKTPATDAALREQRAILHAVAHARRQPVEGGCGFLEPPAINAWGLAAYGVFAEKLARDDRGIAGGHGAVPQRVAFLRSARAAAVVFLERAARRREAAAPGSGASLTAAVAAYRAELEEGLGPLDKLVSGKDELALADAGLRHDAANLLEKAVGHEHEAIVALEKEAFLARAFPEPLARALSSARTTPVPETLASDLVRLAEDQDADARLLAVVTLMDTPGPVAHAALGRSLLDGDGPVAEAALVALEARGEPGLVDLLLKAWDEGPRTRARSDRPLQRSLVFAVAARAASDDKARALLERAVDDGGEGDDIPDAIPRWAATLLYHLRGVDCEPVLLKVMASPRPGARRAAASILDLSGSKEALAALDLALADQDASVRLTAAAALGRRGTKKAIDVALAALRDASRDVRAAAVEALTRTGPHALPALAKLLEDKDWRTRANASVVLVRNGGAAELARVAALEKDPEELVRDLAVQAKAILEARARAEEKK
jgi:HEAT repeat protein